MENEMCPSKTVSKDETYIERHTVIQQFGNLKDDHNRRISSASSRPTSASSVNPEIIGEATSPTYTTRNKKETTELKTKNKRGFEKSISCHQKEIETLTAQLQDKAKIIAEQENTIRQLEERNNETLTRLSAMASAKLTDGNANIADLSDENRPTKLSEKFSELYDNEWTNAFEYLTESKKLEEETAILLLLKVLCVIYLNCKTKASEDYRTLVTSIQSFIVSKGSLNQTETQNMGNCLAKSSVNEMPNGVSELMLVPSGMPTIRVKQRGEINSIDEVIAGQLAKIKNLEELLTRDDVKSKDTVIAGHLAKIKDLEDRNDELLTRLSLLASAKLTDGNANIADLSDENRPTKLAEQFSELYDNEWTDLKEF